jgi:hypothetical protein
MARARIMPLVDQRNANAQLHYADLQLRLQATDGAPVMFGMAGAKARFPGSINVTDCARRRRGSDRRLCELFGRRSDGRQCGEHHNRAGRRRRADLYRQLQPESRREDDATVRRSRQE